VADPPPDFPGFFFSHLSGPRSLFAPPKPLAAQHAHILEKLIGNSIPFWTPAILLNVHCTTFMMWTVFRITEAIEAHSGYDLPFSPFGLMHDGGKVHRKDGVPFLLYLLGHVHALRTKVVFLRLFFGN